MNMQEDIFAQHSFGKIALQKLAPVSSEFRLYSAGWLGKNVDKADVMQVTGAEFRVAKAGREKGKLSVKLKGTDRYVFVTRAEILAFESRAALPSGAGRQPGTAI